MYESLPPYRLLDKKEKKLFFQKLNIDHKKMTESECVTRKDKKRISFNEEPLTKCNKVLIKISRKKTLTRKAAP